VSILVDKIFKIVQTSKHRRQCGSNKEVNVMNKYFLYLTTDLSSFSAKGIMEALGFHKEIARFDAGLCSACGGDRGVFKNDLSQREYRISGMCQTCQDDIWKD
tara:strand:- start:416 stop:724 length:309 start_codon:yes stop_codon:yes gene_type:complete